MYYYLLMVCASEFMKKKKKKNVRMDEAELSTPFGAIRSTFTAEQTSGTRRKRNRN